MSKTVRVVVVGDAKTGKTSLITTLLSGAFQPQVAPVIPEVSTPSTATTDKFTTRIVDTSSKKSDRLIVEREIKKADVVCLVYDVSRPETFNRVTTCWLPEIRRLSDTGKPRKPVILVGNKIELRGTGATNSDLEQEILPIMDLFKEVETCIECSAKTLLNIHEVFYFAEKAVFYPTEVLYDSSSKRMKDDCARALKRIFNLCDKDKDGILNDEELNQFQNRCFSASLQSDELSGVKDVVRSGMPNGVSEDGLNVKGFLYLHHLFIQKGRLETTWTVLRKFGYADNLQLRDSFLCPLDKKDLQGHICELSKVGYEFFTEIFERHDKDRDGALSTDELDELFSTCYPPTWPAEWGKNFPQDIVQTNEHGYVTLEGWLSIWSMTARLRPTTTLRYLAFLGFEGDTTQALDILVKGQKIRTFRCFVFGPPGCGKSTFLNGLIGKLPVDLEDSTHIPTIARKFVVHQVQTQTEPTTKYLIMHEFGREEAKVLESAKKLAACDIACILFDGSDPHFGEYCARVKEKIIKHNPTLPCIYFTTKTDLTMLDESFANRIAKLKISSPKPLSLKSPLSEVYKDVVYEAENPSPKYLACGRRTEYSKVRLLGGIFAASVLIGVPLVCLFIWSRRGTK